MKSEQELAEFYDRLKKELVETSLFPTKYLYKFIIPSDEAKLEQLKDVFKETSAEISTRPSSLTVKNPDEVIKYYKEAGKVEGILSL